MAEGKIDPSAPVPARIHVIVAREAPYAVVSRCDLSPDGKHFIYFAFNGVWESETRGSWTAISRAPYLKAIGLWGKGDCWNGGGLFLTNRKFWINDGYGHTTLRAPQKLTRIETHPTAPAQLGECPGVYDPRLLRDGWQSGHAELAKQLSGAHRDVAIFEKRIDRRWKLRKYAIGTSNHPVGKGCYYDEHALIDTVSGGKIDAKVWEWADFVRGRLLWSRDGAIYSGRLTNEGIKDETMLKDFNSMRFEPIKAPY